MNRPITPDIEKAVKILQPICEECGYTIHAIRSINNGHLSAKCDGCGRRVME